ncbi:phosphatidylethanolamineN-methyltransferase-like protein [Cricetulus griseus]|nr:phosphatidylethanolamineN-methyltransferase-like protein [Cricetulus griseus]
MADLFVMTWLLGYVDPTEPSFVAAVLTIVFSPLFWNVEVSESSPHAGVAIFVDLPLDSFHHGFCGLFFLIFLSAFWVPM